MPIYLKPTLRDAIQAASRPLAGIWVCSGSPLVAEIVAGSGIDCNYVADRCDTASCVNQLRINQLRMEGTTMATTRFAVTATSWVTPTLRRVHLHSEDLSAFAESSFTDRYVKLVFPKPGVEYPDQIDVRALRGTLPPEDLPDVRTYTALNVDVGAGTIDIDFVVHGDEGIAGPWAQSAAVGDILLANGPGGAYRPNPDADWHLLVGDESAIPAVAAALEALPADAVARVVVLVESEAHEPQLTLLANATVIFVHRDSAVDGALEAAVRAVEWLDGRLHAFVHGEAEEIMKGVRPYLRTERGLARDQLSISGYWRRGRTEDGFREWKAELARAEGDETRTGGRPPREPFAASLR